MSQRLLIVDDDADMRRFMRSTLETAGYAVGEAADGPQGLAVFGDGATWDLVLLDQVMPGMEGLDVLREIASRAPTARVILMTAFASLALAEEAMRLGATDFLRKPMTPEIVCQAVTGALAHVSATPPSSEPMAEAHAKRLHIEALRINGFQIGRGLDNEGGQTPDMPGTYPFLVHSSLGSTQTVVVAVTQQAVTMVEQATGSLFPLTNPFWKYYAGRRLATYLWHEGHIPFFPLTITRFDPEDVHVATRDDFS